MIDAKSYERIVVVSAPNPEEFIKAIHPRMQNEGFVMLEETFTVSGTQQAPLYTVLLVKAGRWG